jgi:hypothetical protein
MTINSNYNNEFDLFANFNEKDNKTNNVSKNENITKACSCCGTSSCSIDKPTSELNLNNDKYYSDNVIFNNKDFADYTIRNFSFLDKDSNGFIKESELSLSRDITEDGYTFNVVKNKLDVFSNIIDKDNNGISKKEVFDLKKGNGFDFDTLKDIGALPINQTFLSSQKADISLPNGFQFKLDKLNSIFKNDFEKSVYSKESGGVISSEKESFNSQKYNLSVNSNNISIIVPVDKNIPIRDIDVQNISKAISALPNFLIKEIKEIEFNPFQIKTDTNNLIDMTANNGKVTLYPIGNRNIKDTYKTLIHEVGHNITHKLWNNDYQNNSKWDNWTNAMKKDPISSSEYALTNPLEDFSEAFTMYVTAKDDTHKAELTNLMPNRFKIIDDIVSQLENNKTNYNQNTQVNLKPVDNNTKPNEKVKKNLSFDDIFNTSY